MHDAGGAGERGGRLAEEPGQAQVDGLVGIGDALRPRAPGRRPVTEEEVRRREGFEGLGERTGFERRSIDLGARRALAEAFRQRLRPRGIRTDVGDHAVDVLVPREGFHERRTYIAARAEHEGHRRGGTQLEVLPAGDAARLGGHGQDGIDSSAPLLTLPRPMEPWTLWLVLPLVGALIGYATNRLAVRMIFRPVEPRRILGFRVQGLIGRRQPELARSIGAVVGDHLVRPEDLAGALEAVDLEALVDRAFERGLRPKIEELRQLPLVGGFLTDERVADLRRHAVKGVASNREELAGALQEGLENGVDVHAVVEAKVAAFPVARIEELVLQVASRELRSIEILGGVLGGLVGLAQAGLLALV